MRHRPTQGAVFLCKNHLTLTLDQEEFLGGGDFGFQISDFTFQNFKLINTHLTFLPQP